MLLDRIAPPDTPTTDTVTVAWHECAARALRKSTQAGRPVSVLIPIGHSLRDGDVLTDDARENAVRVHVPPCDVWLITPTDACQLAIIAIELGNLHVPVEVTPVGELLTVPDGPTRQVLDRYGVPYTSHARVFAPRRATVLQGVKLAEGFGVKRGG